MRIRKLFIACALVISYVSAFAQDEIISVQNEAPSTQSGVSAVQNEFPSITNPSFISKVDTEKADRNILNHLDLGLSAGSTGLGIDLAMPISDYVRVRAGAYYMPPIRIPGYYTAEVGDFANTKEEMDSRFEKLSGLLETFTGMKAQDRINTYKEPTFTNAKFVVDVFPFRNKHWHFSAGVFYGGKQVGKIYNQTKDMTTLVAMQIYNNMYKKAVAEEPLIEYNGIAVYLPPEYTDKIREFGLITVPIGEFKNDYIAQEDVFWDYTEVDGLTLETIHEKGDLRCAKGDVLYKKGEMYRMMPDPEDNMVKATCEVNKFRPYVGFGYGGPVSASGRTSLSVEAGVLFWGGTPKVKTVDGIDVIHDLTNLRKQVVPEANFIKAFPVFPVLEVRFSHRIF